MTWDLPRHLPQPQLAQGLWRAEHFQIAYATNDMDRACAQFKNQLGITAFRRLEGALPAGGSIRVELAWAGPVMVELLTAEGAGSAIYMDRLMQHRPSDTGFAIQLHHLGYLVADQSQWDAMLSKAADCGFAVPHSNNNPGFLRSCFVDATPLGHYLEYILPEPAGLDFFRSVPVS